MLVEREAPGGQAGTSSRIENYPGFPSGLSGGDLARRAVAQARRFGVEILSPREVAGLRVADPYRYVTLGDGSEFACHAVLLATGVQYRTLDVPGLVKLTGAGVYLIAGIYEGIQNLMMQARQRERMATLGKLSAGLARDLVSARSCGGDAGPRHDPDPVDRPRTTMH